MIACLPYRYPSFIKRDLFLIRKIKYGIVWSQKCSPFDDSAGQIQTEHRLGHAAFLRHLNEIEPGEPESPVGAVIFDLALQILSIDRRVRLEDQFAMLASAGGQQCIAPIVRAAPANANFDTFDLIAVQGNDGRLYLFGDPLNRLLLEPKETLLSIAFGAAQTWGTRYGDYYLRRNEIRDFAYRKSGICDPGPAISPYGR